MIGAGPAGLAVAWRLSAAGHRVVVVESSERIGGLAASLDVSGVRVDLGIHRLDPAMAPEVRRAVDELVEVQARPRHDRIRAAGRWFPFPLTNVGLLRGLPSLLRAGHGPTARRHVNEAHAWKLWGTDPRQLVEDPTRPRTSASSPTTGSARPVRGARRRPVFLYPRRGFGSLVEAMAERVPEIRAGTKVTGLIEHHDRVIVGLADGRIVTASHVFSTVPAGQTARWLGLHAAERPPPVRAVVLVYLTVPRRPYTPFGAHHLPARQVLPICVSEPANHRDDPADPTDRTVLCAELPCWEGDDVWRAGDAELGLRVADDLVRSGLPEPHAVAVTTVRLPAVYPVMTPVARAEVAAAERALRASRRVTVLGGQGSPTPDDIHRELETAFAAARCVAPTGDFDHDRWGASPARVGGVVVEG